MRLHTALLVAGAFLLTACDRTPDPICQELDAAIDTSIRHVALSLVEGDIYDKGAMQQAARYTAANNYLQVIRINLDLQSQHKCPIRKSVINPMMYEKDARQCMLATLGSKTEEVSKACDVKNWKGNAK
jgi:hypothetical protein